MNYLENLYSIAKDSQEKNFEKKYKHAEKIKNQVDRKFKNKIYPYFLELSSEGKTEYDYDVNNQYELELDDLDLANLENLGFKIKYYKSNKDSLEKITISWNLRTVPKKLSLWFKLKRFLLNN